MGEGKRQKVIAVTRKQGEFLSLKKKETEKKIHKKLSWGEYLELIAIRGALK